MLHIPWFFKRVHYIHHAYDAPYSLVGGIAHPFEFVFNFTLPIIAGPIAVGLFVPFLLLATLIAGL
jgi:sterol desaturase/sphingolipid hydroxylase (fatty acid hydroxylase superfamily)